MKKVPLLPHVFDSLLKLWTMVTNPNLADQLDDIEAEVLSWHGTSSCMHRYGGIQFNYNGKEIGHIHSNGLLDILFTREIKCQLMNEGMVNQHHVFTRSGWISFYIKKNEDVAYAIELLRRSGRIEARG
ncbi:luciferase domain-containing protein [Mucilaginibacter paludis]|uniref:Luciferase domain-containing protein n=1 Tax=Mucilaginibacter paludis DSM 18603 TaxID=714943 RepID=H1Y0D3_9SPHI|nr:luciferase family protein [Mucilaginibacter paludis]EHQ28182.1 hypothetical protein Mucpa_4091 [Mucilaginibacter paludis DSM 18603]